MSMIKLAIGLMALMLVTGLPAQAHKVNMFAFAEGKEVFVEGYFTDGKKPKKCEVIVYDAENKQLLTGLSNEDGQFSFVIPAPGGLRITLNAGEGHMAEYILSAEELGEEDSSEKDAPAMPVTAAGTNDSAALAVTTGNKALQLMVRKAAGQAMRPVMRALDELKARRSLSDIIGGIGIIMGIGGLFLYFQARKMTKKPD